MPRNRQLLVEGYRARRVDSGKVASLGYSAAKKNPSSAGRKLPNTASAVKKPAQSTQSNVKR